MTFVSHVPPITTTPSPMILLTTAVLTASLVAGQAPECVRALDSARMDSILAGEMRRAHAPVRR